MSTRPPSSETLHASCIGLKGRAVLIAGRSGAGKSDLALRLIDRGASLVSDDYTLLRRVGTRLLASAPPNIVGMMEVRGVGLIELPFERDLPTALIIDLDEPVARMPDGQVKRSVAGVDLPVIGLAAFEASAPIKVEMALLRLGAP